MENAHTSTTKVAVVTGSNKGIGFGVVKALLQAPFPGEVYLTARDAVRGQDAVKELEKLGLHPRFHQLDISSEESVTKFRAHIQDNYGCLDVLVNNAGIMFKPSSKEPLALQARETLQVNYFDTLAFCNSMFPLLRPGARVCNVSSATGHLSKIPGPELRAQLAAENLTESRLSALMSQFVHEASNGTHGRSGWPNSPYVAYLVSKVGLAALTRVQQRELVEKRPGADILVNCCHPGYVSTDMTSHMGPLNIDHGAVAPTYLALLPPGRELNGAYVWHDTRVVDWVNGPMPAPY